MHSISPYAIRCCNPALPAKQRYFTLDKIGQNDLFELIKNFITPKIGSHSSNKDSKQTYSFSDVTFDKNQRKIYGFFNVGNFGIANDIINSDTGATEFTKTIKSADVIKHYFQFFLPIGYDEGFCVFYSYRGNGIKTLFYEEFNPIFKSTTTFKLQMNPLSYEKAFKAWSDANVKEIKVTKFSNVPDPADIPKYKGHIEAEITLKPDGKLLSFGKFVNFQKSGTDENALAEYLNGIGSQTKAVVQIGTKKRTFAIGANESNSICQIELDNTVIINDGIPDLSSIHIFSDGIIGEYTDELYKKPKRVAP